MKELKWNTLQSCFLYVTYIFIIYCSICSNVAIPSAVTNKTHEHLNSTQYYHEDGKKSEKLNNRDVRLVSGNVPQNLGWMITVQCGVPLSSIRVFFPSFFLPTICHHHLLKPKPLYRWYYHHLHPTIDHFENSLNVEDLSLHHADW